MQFYFFCVCGDVLSFINSMQNFKTFHKNCFNAQDGWEKKLHTKEFQQKGSITHKHEMQVASKEKRFTGKTSEECSKHFQPYCHWKRYFIRT